MKSFLSRLFAPLIRLWFETRLENEIHNKLCAHLKHEGNFGYPFESDEEFQKQVVEAKLDAKLGLALIEKECEAMPQAYGDAFRYIAYRDLNRRIAMYRLLAKRRMLRSHAVLQPA